MEKENDSLINTSLSLKRANDIRSKIMEKFPRTWVLVHNIENKKWKINVCNNWGGNLEKSKIKEIKSYIKSV